jgi:hypothetical protein
MRRGLSTGATLVIGGTAFLLCLLLYFGLPSQPLTLATSTEYRVLSLGMEFFTGTSRTHVLRDLIHGSRVGPGMIVVALLVLGLLVGPLRTKPLLPATGPRGQDRETGPSSAAPGYPRSTVPHSDFPVADLRSVAERNGIPWKAEFETSGGAYALLALSRMELDDLTGSTSGVAAAPRPEAGRMPTETTDARDVQDLPTPEPPDSEADVPRPQEPAPAADLPLPSPEPVSSPPEPSDPELYPSIGSVYSSTPLYESSATVYGSANYADGTPDGIADAADPASADADRSAGHGDPDFLDTNEGDRP